MKHYAILTATILVSFWAATTAQAQTALTGVWELQEITSDGGAYPGRNTEPGLYFFGNERYSMMFVRAPRPLEPEDTPRSELTEEQVRAAYEPFTANAGIYEVEGSTVTVHPSVALGARFMSGGQLTLEFRIEGSNLTLTSTNDDGEKTISRLVRVE